jgi:phosphinothricin acetyltransferase
MGPHIRLARDSDADRVAAIYRPSVEAAATSFETEAPDRAEMARRIVDTTRTFPWLVCERDGRVAGYAYASQHRVRAAYRWSVDTAIYVDADCRRSGVGRGLYLSLFAVLDAQGYVNAYAGITLPNPGSVAIHESVGFRAVGVYHRVGYKLGAWHDVGWWERELKPHQEPPAEPLPLGAVLDRSDWGALVAAGEPAIRVR